MKWEGSIGDQSMNYSSKKIIVFVSPVMFAALLLIIYFISGFSQQVVAAQIDYCVTEAVSGEPIIESTSWKDITCNKVITMSAARGEFEPASLVLRSNYNAEEITVRMTDLKSDTGIVPSGSINLKFVKTWYQSASAWRGIREEEGRRKLVPELLLNDVALVRVDHRRRRNYLRVIVESGNEYRDISSEYASARIKKPSTKLWDVRDKNSLQSIELTKDKNQQLWLTVQVPKTTKSGVYSGFVEIKDNASLVVNVVPVKLQVRPYELARPILEYSIYYRGVLSEGSGTISAESKSSLQMLNDLINMKNHGVSNPTIYQNYKDPEGFRQVLKLREKAGVSNKNIYYLGVTTGNYTDSNDVEERFRYLEKLLKIAKKEGVKNLYIYGVDEADEEHFSGQYPLWERLRGMGMKVFVAAWRGDRERLLAGKVDLFVNGIEPTRSVNEAFARAGTKVFLYNQPQVGVENPLVYRKNYGFSAWEAGFSGAMNYAYQDGFGFIWNDFDNTKFRDHVYAYPTTETVIDTIAWEGFREAVDDVRYLSTLIGMIEEYSESSPRLAEKSRAYLRKLKTTKTEPRFIRRELDRLISGLCCSTSSGEYKN